MKESENILFGIRPVIEAIKSGKNLEKIYFQVGATGPLISELRELCKESLTPFVFVPVEKLNKLTRNVHQGVVAFGATINYHSIDEVVSQLLDEKKVPLILILDRITDVRNFGAICRTAECTGVHAVVIPAMGSAAVNGDAIKTSAGALNVIKVCKEHNLKFVIDNLKEAGLQIISCTEKATKNYTEVDYTLPTAIVLGSEENGISPEYIKRSDEKVKLPILGIIESLNVSVANGVILYEAVRQRG